MITIEVNNRKIEAKPGEYILSALKRAGIHVPTLCHMEGMLPSGACRMCVVEVEGMPGLIPSCAFPVQEGMKIQTHSPKVVTARQTIVDLLLANHPDDCLYCERNQNCELQNLSREFGVMDRQFRGAKNKYNIDDSSPSIVRDQSKCILCGRCIRMCEEVQGVSSIDFVGRGAKTVVGTAFNEGMNISSCINCGQCVMVCPTGALRGQSYVDEVIAALDDPNKIVVVQHAPAVSVTFGESVGMKPGTDAQGIMTSALRELGFKYVFDTSFSADLTIMEEASELVHRIQNGGTLPMFTSCSPGWIKFVEQFYPEFIPNLSSCKSPQMMLGAIIKSYFAQREGIDPDKIFSVSIMPCTAKKFESGRPEMMRESYPDLDAVLTTRELIQLVRMRGINVAGLAPDYSDTPFGERSSAGKLFGVSGGVMEAALRTAHFFITGKELEAQQIPDIRGLDGVKTTKVKINGLELGIGVVNGLKNARTLLEEIKAGRNDLHFIEVMTCPSGCIGGGGQPIGIDTSAVAQRMKALYKIDKDSDLRVSHKNTSIQRIYNEFLGKPLGEKSHHLLHTHYTKRDVLK